MIEQPAPQRQPAQTEVLADAWARPVMERQLQMLGELAELGLNIARAVEAQATGTGEAIVHDVGIAYARVSRAVRLTVSLQSTVIANIKWQGHCEAREQAQAKTADNDRREMEDDRKSSVERIVARVIDASFDDEDQAEYVEQLAKEVSERLDDEDFCDVLSRPTSEIVAMICRDLGLAPDWTRLAEEAWAQKEIASGKPGSPLAVVMVQSGETRAPSPTADPIRFTLQAASP